MNAKKNLILAAGLLLTCGLLLWLAPEAPETALTTPVADAGASTEHTAQVSNRRAAEADAVAEAILKAEQEENPALTREGRAAANAAEHELAAENRTELFERTIDNLHDAAERADAMGRDGQAALMRRRTQELLKRWDAELSEDG